MVIAASATVSHLTHFKYIGPANRLRLSARQEMMLNPTYLLPVCGGGIMVGSFALLQESSLVKQWFLAGRQATVACLLEQCLL